jgi:hypothetical protein
MRQRFALYAGIHLGHFAVADAVYDTPEEAADAARALVLENLRTKRIETNGDPMALAVLVLPVPVNPIWIPDCLKDKEPSLPDNGVALKETP